MYSRFSRSLTAISAISGSVNDFPRTYPTTAAMNGDMPGKRAGLSFRTRDSFKGQPSGNWIAGRADQARLSCHDTPKRSLSQPNFRLNP